MNTEQKSCEAAEKQYHTTTSSTDIIKRNAYQLGYIAGFESGKAEGLESRQGECESAIDFGDFVTVEMKRYGVPNEFYMHKVIGRLQSNTWVDVPIQSPYKETQHNEMEDVLRVITCGVSETEVFKVRLCDVKVTNRNQLLR